MTNVDKVLTFAHCYREKPAPMLGGDKVFTPDELIRRMDEQGVREIILAPLTNPEACVEMQSNEEVLRICEAHPDRFIPFVNLDPRNVYNTAKADFVWVLEYYKAKGCRGAGVVEACLPIEDRRVRNLFRAAEKNGLPLVIRLAPFPTIGLGLSVERGLAELERALQDFPNLQLYIAGENYFADNEKVLAAFRAKYANLHVAKEFTK